MGSKVLSTNPTFSKERIEVLINKFQIILIIQIDLQPFNFHKLIIIAIFCFLTFL